MTGKFLRRLTGAAAILAIGMATSSATPASAADTIKIGFGIAQTGPLAPGGKSAILAMKIWAEDHAQSLPPC